MLMNTNGNDVDPADKVFYRIGQIIWLPVGIFGLWFARQGYALIEGKAFCSFQAVTGLPCPGCGGTRAFYRLFQGEILQSMVYNPVVVAGVAAYLHYMTVMTLRRRRLVVRDYKRRLLVQYELYFVAVVLVAQWLWKLCRILFFL